MEFQEPKHVHVFKEGVGTIKVRESELAHYEANGYAIEDTIQQPKRSGRKARLRSFVGSSEPISEGAESAES